MNPAAIKLFVVDDHPVVRAGLRTIEELAPHIRIVGDAADISSALEGIARTRPDVALLDVRLKDESGIDLCRTLKAAGGSPRVLMLTSFIDDRLTLAAIEAGADGYLLKESDTMRLVHAIEEVHRGGTVFDARPAARHLSEGSPFPALTAQERRLIAEIARGRTDKEAAEQLGLSPKTVRNYLDRIFTKLGVHTRTEAAAAFIRSGEPPAE